LTRNPDHPAKKRRSRPFSVTLLAIGVLTIAGIHLIRLYQTIQNWDFLAGLPGVPPVYLALSGLVWAVVGFPLGISLWRGDPTTLPAVRFITAAYIIYDWFNRLFAAYRSSSLSTGFAWEFSALITVILLVWVYWIVSRPRVKAYFRRD
jgi:hypothetical protein